MERIAAFGQISVAQIIQDSKSFMIDTSGEISSEVIDQINKLVEEIKSPARATAGSAGYDFVCPFDIDLEPGNTYTLGTGVRAMISPGWVLMMYPRSGLASKYGMRFANTIPVIDSDYYHANNEGHILLKVSVDKPMHITKGTRIAQGVFLPFGITLDDEADGARTGGFGSTGVQ